MEPLLPSNVPRRLVKVAIYFSFSLSVLGFHRLLGYLCLQSVYDKHLGEEFQSEIRTLAQVEHLHLVKFYGYLEHEDERIVLMEYVPNGTLREHLDCEFLATIYIYIYMCIVLDVADGDVYMFANVGNFVDSRMTLMQACMEMLLTLLCA
jgi:serine/threonine protein kinase